MHAHAAYISQLAFYVNLHRAVIGPSATLTGRWRPDIDLRRMLTGYDLELLLVRCILGRQSIFHIRVAAAKTLSRLRGRACTLNLELCWSDVFWDSFSYFTMFSTAKILNRLRARGSTCCYDILLISCFLGLQPILQIKAFNQTALMLDICWSDTFSCVVCN